LLKLGNGSCKTFDHLLIGETRSDSLEPFNPLVDLVALLAHWRPAF
jgi:hypothetical protein